MFARQPPAVIALLAELSILLQLAHPAGGCILHLDEIRVRGIELCLTNPPCCLCAARAVPSRSSDWHGLQSNDVRDGGLCNVGWSSRYLPPSSRLAPALEHHVVAANGAPRVMPIEPHFRALCNTTPTHQRQTAKPTPSRHFAHGRKREWWDRGLSHRRW